MKNYLVFLNLAQNIKTKTMIIVIIYINDYY